MAKELIALKVKCPKCKQSLMDYTSYHNAHPSIKLEIGIKEEKGTINLCATYGCFEKSSDIKLVVGEIADLSCPHCHTNLKGTMTCDICSAPIIDLELDKGGRVHACSRIGCKKHFVTFEDIYNTLINFYNEYEYGSREPDL